jgi:hypothetical protein
VNEDSHQEKSMYDFSVRRRASSLVVLSGVIALVACEDKRVKDLSAGITRDSAMTVIAQEIRGGGSDSFPNVYTRDRYLLGGKNYEILYFAPNNEKQGKDSVPWKKLTPIVFVNNKLLAKGWPAWDSISRANKIPTKEQADSVARVKRADSIDMVKKTTPNDLKK